jgi:hypothetical protein
VVLTEVTGGATPVPAGLAWYTVQEVAGGPSGAPFAAPAPAQVPAARASNPAASRIDGPANDRLRRITSA